MPIRLFPHVPRYAPQQEPARSARFLMAGNFSSVNSRLFLGRVPAPARPAAGGRSRASSGSCRRSAACSRCRIPAGSGRGLSSWSTGRNRTAPGGGFPGATCTAEEAVYQSAASSCLTRFSWTPRPAGRSQCEQYPISSPGFQVNIKFVPDYRPYSDANPEQTASRPGRLPAMPGMRFPAGEHHARNPGNPGGRAAGRREAWHPGYPRRQPRLKVSKSSRNSPGRKRVFLFACWCRWADTGTWPVTRMAIRLPLSR
jgi:hypothetical protein